MNDFNAQLLEFLQAEKDAGTIEHIVLIDQATGEVTELGEKKDKKLSFLARVLPKGLRERRK